MSPPRIERSSRWLSVSRSRPSNVMLPLTLAPWSWVSPIVVSEETVLPEPDSPTMHSVWPSRTS